MSWNDLSRTSQPPVADFGVPTSSPLSACQLASPMMCQPVSADPVNVQSGLNVVRVPYKGTVTTAAMTAAPNTPIRFRVFIAAPLTSVPTSRYDWYNGYDRREERTGASPLS